jgi:hypothetical protein
MENLIIILVVVLALVIGLFLLKYLFLGALFLFAWAGEQGFVGTAAYIACWVFLFPFMLAASIIVGAVISWSN